MLREGLIIVDIILEKYDHNHIITIADLGALNNFLSFFFFMKFNSMVVIIWISIKLEISALYRSPDRLGSQELLWTALS